MSANTPTPPHQVDAAPGSLLGGYRVEARLGAGAAGTVYRARDETRGRIVALKVPPPHLAADAAFREQFVRTSRAAAAVDHPHILPIHTAGERAGVLHIAMRYVAGGDLHALLHASGPMSPDQAMGVLAPVAAALDAAHRAGFVHGGVKPADILVDRFADDTIHPYLADLGLSGTPSAYAAPEQRGGHRIGPQTDQYALGCVAFELLTGRLPGQAPVARLRPDLPVGVDAAIATATAADPRQRYASCRDLVTALGHVFGGIAREIAEADYDVRHAPEPDVLPASSEPASGAAAWSAPAEPRTVAGEQEKPDAKRPGKRSRTLTAAVVTALTVAAFVGVVVAVRPAVSGSHTEKPPAPVAKSTGSVSLAHTLSLAGNQSPTAVQIRADGTLTVLDESGALTSSDTGSGARTSRTRLRAGGARLRTADAAFASDGATVVVPDATCGKTATSPCEYRIFETAKGRPQQPVPGGTGAGFSVGGDLMAVISDEEAGVETWRPASHSIQDGGLGRTGLEEREVRGVGLDPTGATMVVSTQGSTGSSLLWYADMLHPDDRRPSIAATIPVPAARTRLLLSGQTLAAGDATSTDLFRAMDGHPDQRRHAALAGMPLAVSPDDGDYVATLDRSSGRVSLWDTTQLLPVAWQKGEKPDQTVPLSPTATMSCAIGTPTSAAFGSDGRTLAVGCSDGEVNVWKVG